MVVQDNAYYYVSANLVEDFSKMTREDMENAPVFNIASQNVELGKMAGSTPKRQTLSSQIQAKRPDNQICKISCGCTAIQEGIAGRASSPDNRVLSRRSSTLWLQGEDLQKLFMSIQTILRIQRLCLR